jgi:hypothetical protein
VKKYISEIEEVKKYISEIEGVQKYNYFAE